MTRTTPSEVTNIYNTELSADALGQWIAMAHGLVDDIEQAASNAGNTIPNDRLKQLETLLAAHFASAQDPRIAEGDRESGSVTYQGETGLALESTKYGQNAILLDPTGTLADLNGGDDGGGSGGGGTLTRNANRTITITPDTEQSGSGGAGGAGG